MVVKRRVTTYRNDPMGTVQYILGLVIAIMFGLSLIPFSYGDFFYLTLGLIVVQMIVSLVRFRIVNFFFETIMLVLAIIGIIPFMIGYLFRLVAIPIAIIDMATFKSSGIYKKVEIITSNGIGMKSKTNTKRKPKKPSKPKTKVKDADFEEK